MPGKTRTMPTKASGSPATNPGRCRHPGRCRYGAAAARHPCSGAYLITRGRAPLTLPPRRGGPSREATGVGTAPKLGKHRRRPEGAVLKLKVRTGFHLAQTHPPAPSPPGCFATRPPLRGCGTGHANQSRCLIFFVPPDDGRFKPFSEADRAILPHVGTSVALAGRRACGRRQLRSASSRSITARKGGRASWTVSHT